MTDTNTSTFPSDPTARKVILVLSQYDFEKCEYDPDGSEILTDDEVFVLAYPVRVEGEVPEVLRNILQQNVARPGEILVQSPFDPNVYMPAGLAPERFALDKHLNVSMLCQLLGARSLRVEQIDLRTSNRKTTVSLKASKSGGSVGASVENEQLEAFRNKMNFSMTCAGGPPDIAKAEQMLEKTGLWSDPQLKALLDMRRDRPNALISYKLTLSLSSDIQSNLNIAARAKIPNFVNVSAEYKQVVKNRYEYTVTLDVAF